MKNRFHFKIGDKSSISKTFEESEVLEFSKMSKDSNPIHFDSNYASSSRFGNRIVQGPFVMSLIGGILGSSLPGNGTIYLNQNSQFKLPIYVGDTVTAHVQIIDIREDKPIIKLRTWIMKEGQIAIDGEAVVFYINDEN